MTTNILNEYIQAAVKTESRIPVVKTNRQQLMSTIDTLIAVGNLLDVLKKDTFYGLPTTPEKLQGRLKRIEENRQHLKQVAPVASARWDQVADRGDPEELVVDPRVMHAIVGITTEAIELLEALRDSITSNQPIDNVNLLEELGDINWYLAVAVDALNGDWNKILETNITKLKARYEQATFDANATMNRDLDRERSILENGLK